MANVFVFCPAFGRQISSSTFESTHHLMSAFMAKGIHASVSTFSWPDIAEIRNMVLSFWYDVMPESTHLLFVDADMGFSAEMVLDMMAFSEPVVGAIYPKKTYPIEWAASGLDGAELRRGFLEVEGLGAGCLLIRRDAVAAMIEKFPDLIFDYMTLTDMAQAGAKRTFGFFDPIRVETGKVSEDISFCRRWRETGGKVWASIGHQITHVGPWAFSACFAKERAANIGVHISKDREEILSGELEKCE